MGVYIPNMEKPKRCGECPLYDSEYPWKCELIDGKCPLIDIVTCGECIHYHDHDCPIDWGLTETDFCSYGERRMI